MPKREARERFIEQNTQIVSPPPFPKSGSILPRNRCRCGRTLRRELGTLGLPPPFWAFAWAGGQALARYILDHRFIVRRRTVTDLAAGSGLVGIAAAIAGAEAVTAADIGRIRPRCHEAQFRA
jgi:predicted nicotinamide N-methyase